MPGKRAARPPTKQRALKAGVVGVVTLLVTALVVWSAFAMLGGQEDGGRASAPASQVSPTSPTSPPSHRADAAGAGHASGTPAPRPSPTRTSKPSKAGTIKPAALRACAKEVVLAEKVVEAAREGVGNWRVHVQARTDMLDGRMSRARMNDIWDRTKLAGPADQRRFEKALGSYQEKATCEQLSAPRGKQEKRVAACVDRFERATEAVDAAEAAMADWRSHLGHMAAYAAGDLSRDEAQSMWVRAWRRAPVHIRNYDKSRTALADARPCRASAT